MMSGAEKRVYACAHCSYHTDRRNNLKRHIATMHEATTTELECCGAKFINKSALRQHTSSCHRHGYVCAVCGRVFCRRALLRRHHAVHTGIKEFSCGICSYATSHKSNLDRHMKIHGEDVNYGASVSPPHGSISPSVRREEHSITIPYTTDLTRPVFHYTFPFPNYGTPCFLGEVSCAYPQTNSVNSAVACSYSNSIPENCLGRPVRHPPTDPLYVSVSSPSSRASSSFTSGSNQLNRTGRPRLRHAIDVILGNLTDTDTQGNSARASSASPYSCTSSASSLPELFSMSPQISETTLSPSSTHNQSHMSGGIVTCATEIKPEVTATNAMLVDHPMIENFASSKFSIADNCRTGEEYIHKKWRVAKRFHLS